MEDSILTSTKKIIGLAEEYTAFDLDIITHINAAFSVVTQLGVGPTTGIVIQDETTGWSDLTTIPADQLSMVKTYIFLRVRILFDPPTTSFLLDAMEKQIKEYEWRLSTAREESLL